MAEEFLVKRGLRGKSVIEKSEKFRLGYVADPLPGHDYYRGMLAIPYLRRAEDGGWSVVSIRFRCLEDHEHRGHGKYNTVAGDRPRLFNTLALLDAHDTVCICEGELDAVTATVCGFPAVGVPGSNNWQAHFAEPFRGYETVYVLADGDEPGMKFAHTVASSLSNAKIIPSDPSMDVSDMVIQRGPRALRERIK